MTDSTDPGNQPGEPLKPAATVRTRAALASLVSALVAVGWIWLMVRFRHRGGVLRGPAAALPLLPFVYFTTELVFGRSVPDLAHGWDALAGWQRGVIGTLIVLGLFALTMVVALLSEDWTSV